MSTTDTTTEDWFGTPIPQYRWIVDGLIPLDGYTMLVGKPKSGKSTFLRTLVASIVKNRKFIGRSVEVPDGQGRVLYIHVDRKDRKWQVAEDLRDKRHITREEAERVQLRTSENMPHKWPERLEWLKGEVLKYKPHILVIDLLWRFAAVKNANDYVEVMERLDSLQQKLESIGWEGALVVTMHSRKATNENDEADDVIGSTAQRGSFGSGIYFTHARKAGIYTILSDQTMRDETLGEIDKRVLKLDPVDYTLELGPLVSDLEHAEKEQKTEANAQRLLTFIAQHPRCEMKFITAELRMSKPTVLSLLKRLGDAVRSQGGGVKGDKLLYYVYGMEDGTDSADSVDSQLADLAIADAAAVKAKCVEAAQ